MNKVGNSASPRYRIYRYRYMDVKFQFDYRQSKLRDDGNLDWILVIISGSFLVVFPLKIAVLLRPKDYFYVPLKIPWNDYLHLPKGAEWMIRGAHTPSRESKYAIENTLNWSWPELFPFHILFLSHFFKLLESILIKRTTKKPRGNKRLGFCLKKMQMEISAPKQMEKDIMSASHLWAVLGKKNIQFAWLQKKCMFFFPLPIFFLAVVPFFFL